MILDRSTAHGQAIIRLQETRGLGRQRAGILDGLSFIENAVIENLVFEVQGVSSQRAVGREHEIVVFEVIAGFEPKGAGMVEDPKLRRESRRFTLPVKNQRARHHHERRRNTRGAFFRPQCPARFEKREDLNRLSESHIVRKAAAESEPLQEKKPAESFTLVPPQFTRKAWRRVSSLDPGKLMELSPHLVESRVCPDGFRGK